MFTNQQVSDIIKDCFGGINYQLPQAFLIDLFKNLSHESIHVSIQFSRTNYAVISVFNTYFQLLKNNIQYKEQHDAFLQENNKKLTLVTLITFISNHILNMSASNQNIHRQLMNACRVDYKLPLTDELIIKQIKETVKNMLNLNIRKQYIGPWNTHDELLDFCVTQAEDTARCIAKNTNYAFKYTEKIMPALKELMKKKKFSYEDAIYTDVASQLIGILSRPIALPYIQYAASCRPSLGQTTAGHNKTIKFINNTRSLFGAKPLNEIYSLVDCFMKRIIEIDLQCGVKTYQNENKCFYVKNGSIAGELATDPAWAF